VLLAAAIGLLLAVGGAFLIEYLDDTVKSPEDVTRVADLPVLGTIGRIGGVLYPDKLITVEEPRSPVAEAYRVLRTNIQFSSIDRTARTLMVTSPNPTEGKSVTLANLAVAMAQAGYKVVAVDTDLRRPVLHKVFRMSNNHGLTNAILDHDSESVTHPMPGNGGDPVTFDLSTEENGEDRRAWERPVMDHVKSTDVPNLWLLPSGAVPPNPAELLGSTRLREIVKELAWADIVMFDSPPVLAVTDAAVLGVRVDGVLVVYESGSTRREDAKRAVNELERVGAKVLGVVMNGVPRSRDGYYYRYYYGSEDGGKKKRPHGHSWLASKLPFLSRSKKQDE